MARKKQLVEEEIRLLEQAEDTVGKGVRALSKLLGQAIEAAEAATSGGKYTDKAVKAASHVAWLTTKAAQVADQLRKIEGHDARQLKLLSLSVVLRWYEALDDDTRADFERRIEAIRSGASLLSIG